MNVVVDKNVLALLLVIPKGIIIQVGILRSFTEWFNARGLAVVRNKRKVRAAEKIPGKAVCKRSASLQL